MPELEKLNNNDTVICCFGGMAHKMGGILPFEFLNFLSKTYENKYDLIFYIDTNQCCYHKGIQGITNNIDETILYLNNKFIERKYKKIIFMGVSAGGYASILFGSLCNNVDHVISFIPKTILNDPIDKKYKNLKCFINNYTNYILIGDLSIKNINDDHHILYCELLSEYKNVNIIKMNKVDLKILRDNGTIKKILDDVI